MQSLAVVLTLEPLGEVVSGHNLTSMGLVEVQFAEVALAFPLVGLMAACQERERTGLMEVLQMVGGCRAMHHEELPAAEEVQSRSAVVGYMR